MIDRELLLERLERLERFAIVLDELMPRSADWYCADGERAVKS